MLRLGEGLGLDIWLGDFHYKLSQDASEQHLRLSNFRFSVSYIWFGTSILALLLLGIWPGIDFRRAVTEGLSTSWYGLLKVSFIFQIWLLVTF